MAEPRLDRPHLASGDERVQALDLYIPSIGFCFLLAWALTRPQGYRIATTAAIALVAFSYLYQSASQGMRWQEAGEIADAVTEDYVKLATPAESPVFLCVPGEVGGVPLYMHNLPARLRMEADEEAIEPQVAAYVSFPPGVENHRMLITREGRRTWRISPESKEARGGENQPGGVGLLHR
jgi:hypothetical protein